MSASRRNLDVQFAGGLAWTAGAKWATQLVSWGSLFALARLLSPEDFGISEMASMFVVLTGVLAEFGIATAVLQMQELQPRQLGQLHSFSCLICAAVFLLSLVVAPWMAAFFHIPGLWGLVAVNNLGFLILGFQAVPMGLLQRDLDYRRLSIADGVQILVQSTVAVAAAASGLRYWSFVVGACAGKLSAAILVNYWKQVRFRVPRREDLQVPLRFGWHVAAGRGAWAVYMLSDSIVVGRVLGDVSLGVYRMAMNLASAPGEKVSALLMRAAGPLFARVQKDHELVRRYFLILTEVLALCIAPLMAGLVFVAPLAVEVVLGRDWLAASKPLQWLAAFMIFRALGTLIDQVLISQRLARFSMRLSILNAILMPLALLTVSHWSGSLEGVAACWIVLAPVTFVPALLKLTRQIGLRGRELLGAVWPAVAASGTMVLAVWGVQLMWGSQPWPPFWHLGIQVAAGGLVYGAVLLVLFRERVLRYVRFAQDLRANRQDAGTPAIPPGDTVAKLY